MMRDLEKRLRKLESSLPPEPTEEEKTCLALKAFVRVAVEYYFGDPKPGEPPAAAYARALGYAHEGELKKALKLKASGDNPELNEKHARANRKLFARFGVKKFGDDGKWIEAIKRMEAGVPDWFKDRLKLA